MNLFARSVGGLFSDLAGKRFGMRGRLWSLYILQTIEGAMCIFLGLAKDSLPATIVLMIAFSLFVQSSEGATFGVVPFISKRSLGVVSGLVGAGGNLGSVITQQVRISIQHVVLFLLLLPAVLLCSTRCCGCGDRAGEFTWQLCAQRACHSSACSLQIFFKGTYSTPDGIIYMVRTAPDLGVHRVHSDVQSDLRAHVAS